VPITTRALRRNVLTSLVRASLTSTLVASSAHAASVCTVLDNTDDPASASAAVTALTTSGTLRDCILASNLLTGAIGAPTGSMAITFDPATFTGGAANTIALGDSLPMIFNNTTIDASALTKPVIIDGGGAHRIFFVSGLPDSTQNYNATDLPNPDGAQAISVSFKNLQLRNGKAKGGDGGGGGGLGAGGALFVNQNATVVLSDVGLYSNSAVGGSGTQFVGGGGGMGGAGGHRSGDDKYGSGGGLTGTGSTSGGGIGTSGAVVNGSDVPGIFGGTGLGQISSVQNFGVGFGCVPTKASGYAGGIGAGGFFVGGHGGFGGGGGSGGGIGGFGGGGSSFQAVNGSLFNGIDGTTGGFGGGGGSGANGKNGDGGRDVLYPFAGLDGYTGGSGGFGAGGGGGGGGGFCTNVSAYHWSGHGAAGGLGGVGGGMGAKGTDAGLCTMCPGCGGGGERSEPGVTGPSSGGGGLGGAVFVRKGGSLTVQAGGNRTVSGNSAAAGTGYRNGAAAGAGFFLMSGAAMSDTALAFDISGRYTISDDIGDDSQTGLPSGQSYTPGAGSGITIFKVGPGTLVLDSSNTFSGLVAVGAGALAGNGDVPAQVLLADSATIAPGDPAIKGGIGTLSTGNLVWTSGSSLEIQLGETQAKSDLLLINGTLVKNGPGLPFRVQFGMGAKPPTPGIYTLLTAQSLAGVAASDFYHVQDSTYGSVSGYFSVVGNSVTFTVESVVSNRIFADGFD